MSLLYFAAGCLIVLALHSLLRLISKQPSEKQRKLRRYVLIGGVLVVALALLRFGLPHLAAMFGGLIALITLLSRLMAVAPLFRMFHTQKMHRASKTATSMTAEEARKILGVGPEASNAEIKAAYHALMQKLHPDAGGNDYLASQLNQAKEVLLKKT